jgi:tRNA pseudouridine38-40 synthase
MARFKLYLEYEGTRYSGWQIQKNARTVQGDIHNALVAILKTGEFELYGSGRTDAGVHALYQVAHLEADTMLGPEIIRMKLNDALPSDINVIEVEKAHQNFHARHDAVARSYMYQISRRRTAFGKRFVWWIKDDLNFSQMSRAAALFEGMKNFQSFTADDEEEKSMKVMVEGIQLKEAGDLILIRIVGSHFLWKMVRQIVGVLAEVGRGKMALKEVQQMLDEKSDVAAPLTAPPSGLFLERVYYNDDERLAVLEPMMTVEQPHAFHKPEPRSMQTGARSETLKQHHKTTGGHADKHLHGRATTSPRAEGFKHKYKPAGGKSDMHPHGGATANQRSDDFKHKHPPAGGPHVDTRAAAFDHENKKSGPHGDTRAAAFDHGNKKSNVKAGPYIPHGKKKDRRRSSGPGFSRRP